MCLYVIKDCNTLEPIEELLQVWEYVSYETFETGRFRDELNISFQMLHITDPFLQGSNFTL